VAVLVRHEIGDPTLSMVDVVLPTALVGTNAS
jgi:hypothetical protein